jgi:hypothetical protein
LLNYGADIEMRDRLGQTPPESASKVDSKRILDRISSPSESFWSSIRWSETREDFNKRFLEQKGDDSEEQQNKINPEIDTSRNNPVTEFESNEGTISIYLNEEEKRSEKYSSMASSKLREFFSQVEPKISIPDGEERRLIIDQMKEIHESDLGRFKSENVYEQKEIVLSRNEDLILKSSKNESSGSKVEFKAFDSAQAEYSSGSKKKELKYEEGKEEVFVWSKKHSDLDDEIWLSQQHPQQTYEEYYESEKFENQEPSISQPRPMTPKSSDSTPNFYPPSPSDKSGNVADTSSGKVVYLSPDIKPRKLDMETPGHKKGAISQNFSSMNLSEGKKDLIFSTFDHRNDDTQISNLTKTFKEESKSGNPLVMSMEFSKALGMIK